MPEARPKVEGGVAVAHDIPCLRLHRLKHQARQGLNEWVLDLPGLSGHFAAGLGAAAAGLDAGLHVLQLFATRGARIAYGSAYPTHFTVMRRAHQYQVRARLAYFGAAQHELEMRGFNMGTPHFQTVLGGVP